MLNHLKKILALSLLMSLPAFGMGGNGKNNGLAYQTESDEESDFSDELLEFAPAAEGVQHEGNLRATREMIGKVDSCFGTANALVYALLTTCIVISLMYGR